MQRSLAHHVQGDMRVAPDHTVDGWCWCPARPGVRLSVEVLVNGRVAATVRADLPRRDLRHIGDGAYGFRVALPRAALDPGAPCIVAARAGEDATVFGQRRTDDVPGTPPDPALDASAAALDDVSAGLTALVRRAVPAGRAGPLAGACGELAVVLRAAMRTGSAIAVTRALLAREAAGVCWPRLQNPRASLIVPAPATTEHAIERLRGLAGAARIAGAEILLADSGGDARTALLPSVVRGLRLVAACGPDAVLAAAATAARGAWLVLLDGAGPTSGTALQHLLDRLDAGGIDCVLGAAMAGGLPVVDAAGPIGLMLAVRRERIGDPATLARRARATVAEPWGPPR